MSLGKKLSNYRKLAGLTQQQLGEELNLSPQAISKWENDLAEPDLATLRALAELYKVPIGELIDPNVGATTARAQDKREAAADDEKEVIGFCKNCGITVTEENLAEKTPVILCKRCRDKREADAALAKKQEEDNKKRARYSTIYTHKRRLKISLIVSGLITVVLLAISVYSLISTNQAALLPTTLLGAYVFFSYIGCMFYDCFVRDMFIDWTTKSFQFPGLIFTFDFDGIIWLIGMKLLFWALGLLLGLACAIIGILLGMVCAPFLFPFIMISMGRAIKNGTESKYID